MVLSAALREESSQGQLSGQGPPTVSSDERCSCSPGRHRAYTILTASEGALS